MAKIIKDEISIPPKCVLSKEAIQLLKKTLNKNPSERPDILEVLSEDFFTKYPDKKPERNNFGFI